MFRIIVFADLMLNSNDTTNSDTINFVEAALKNYHNMTLNSSDPTCFNKTDLVVILGNAVDGR